MQVRTLSELYHNYKKSKWYYRMVFNSDLSSVKSIQRSVKPENVGLSYVHFNTDEMTIAYITNNFFLLR